MFRFTIREFLMLMLCAGLGTGWWLDHRAGAEAAEDARMLAQFSANGPGCGMAAAYFTDLQKKYGAERVDWKTLLNQPQDESALGLDVEPWNRRFPNL
jgi:hypothetical protein